MSRANPINNVPNPSTRWFDFSGKTGTVTYYDKETKETVDLGEKFVFILLDSLSAVKGWHDASDSRIFSNEVRDTKRETLVVKAFAGGILAEGLYANIRDRVKAHGGHYVQSCYIAYKDAAGHLAIGNIGFKGAALMAWSDFCKANRSAIDKKAVKINGFTEGKKGSITYRMPNFEIAEVSDAGNAEAEVLADVLRNYYKDYFAKNRTEQVETPPDVQDSPDTEVQADAAAAESSQTDGGSDEIPF